jgi:hypothetical protein
MNASIWTSPRSTGMGKMFAADWLCLAAAPTFAVMALLTAVPGGGPPDMLCSAAKLRHRWAEWSRCAC